MLSFTESKTSRPIAIITGLKEKKILYISDKNDDKINIPKNYNPLDYITIDEIRDKKKYMQQDIIYYILECLKTLTEPRQPELYDIYNDLINLILSRLGKVIKINDGIFEYLPNIDKEREIIYISGASGSGKSYWAAQYMQKYHKITNNDVYLFTNITNDEKFNMGYVHKIDIYDKSIISDPLTTEEMADKLVIFDDTDVLKNKDSQKAIDATKTLILQEGRHTKTSCLITSHLTSNYAKTRTIISELNGFVCYPQYNSHYHLTRFLKIYVGLTPTQIERLFKLNSRWVFISLHVPRFILSEKECYILN